MPIILIFAILLSGGTALAAENALPGDTLYPVKISVNERVREWTAFSEDAKAELEVRLTERRLEEAEKLAVKTDIGEEVQNRIEQNFREYADKVTARIERFRTDNPAKAVEISSNFQTSLDAHARIMNNIGTSLDGKVEVQLNKLATSIKVESAKTTEHRVQVRTQLDTQTNTYLKTVAEGKKKATKNKIIEVKKFVEAKLSGLDVETLAEVHAQINLAEDVFSDGSANFEAGEYKDAFLLFQKAHSTVQRAKLLMSAKLEFENDEDVELSNSPKPSPTPKVSSNNLNRPKSSDEIDDVDEAQDEDNNESSGGINVRARVKINIGL